MNSVIYRFLYCRECDKAEARQALPQQVLVLIALGWTRKAARNSLKGGIC
jgi:hypothetical protein